MDLTTSATPARRPRRGTLLSATTLALATAAVLAACASGDDTSAGSAPDDTGSTPAPTALELSAGATVLGLPEGVGPQPADASAGAGRTTDDLLLHVVTFGSSTCPAVPDDTAESTGDGAVTVTFPEPGDDPCTADYVPTTTVVALPDDVDPAVDLVVTIGQTGEVTLPAGDTDVVWVLPAG